MINSSGRYTGLATQTFGDIDPDVNAWVDGHQVVTVIGATPDSGYVFAHRLADGYVVQLDAANRPDTQFMGAYHHVTLTQDCVASGIEPAADTISDVAVGKFFDTGAPLGLMGRRVAVCANTDDPQFVSPGGGKVWQLIFSTSEVTAVEASTPVESYGAADPVGWSLGG